MRQPWGWRVKLRRPTPELRGQLQDIVELGPLTRKEMLRATAMLTVGFPEGLPLTAEWSTAGPDVVSLRVEAAGCILMHTFKGPRSAMEVNFQSFRLPLRLAQKGRGGRMVRNALLLYDELDVKIVRCSTNKDGNVVWARMRAYPEDHEKELARLRAAILDRMVDKTITPYQRFFLHEVIRRTVYTRPEDLIRNIANAVDGARKVGEEILQDFSWGAIWRLEDALQRAQIKEALSGRHR